MKKFRYLLTAFFFSICAISYAQYEDVHKGDIIDIDGVKAIVFSIDEYGHGSAMTIKALRGKSNPWCPEKHVVGSLSMRNSDDGLENTREIYQFCKNHNIPLSQFPAFEWCHKLGEGWYIPAENQLKSFINYWLGNDQDFNWEEDEETGLDLDAGSPKEINEKIMEAGGTPFFTGVYSSTLSEDKKVVVYAYDENKGTWSFKKIKPASMKMFMSGRAFYDF